MLYWDRVTLKERAKNVLHSSYWMSFLVMLIFAAVTGMMTGTSSGLRWNFDASELSGFAQSAAHFLARLWPLFLTTGLTATVISAAFTFFLVNIAEVGKDRYFTLCRYGTISIEELIWGFKNGRYMDNVKTMLLRSLYTFLWSLLFVVPGIVKHYSYWMVPYILAENPGVSTERAFEISMRTTMNEKWEMFVLSLSFLGWYLLGVLTCGIGVLFVNPYYEATKAELYGALRLKAIREGIADKSEIGAELD